MRAESEQLRIIRQWVAEKKQEAAPRRSQAPAAGSAAVAVTGLSGYFPGCMDAASFFASIDRDEALITAVSDERLDLMTRQGADQEQAAFMRTLRGGFIPDIASFDAGLFGVLPIEAAEMDPRQRLLLMSAWRTLEDAGLTLDALEKSATGVFIGCESNEYARLMVQAGFVPTMGLSQADSMIANRISYHFDLAGPSEMVNATCAGFAVALHRAFTLVRLGLIDRAIVGAANIILLPDPFRALSEAGQLTSAPAVRSFGRDADGFLRAEGAGTILLERLEDAEAARRPVYAVIRNAAVNFNGQGGVSMASPNTEAHAELVKTCYREAGIDPRRVAYLEAQGMGLPVADIAEWTAVNRALTQLCEEMGLSFDPGFCAVSTLKPLAGHMHSAASLGALLRIIRSFQTNKIHEIAGFDQPNEYCDTEASPCRLAVQTESWMPTHEPRLAALHSYGSGGNNAHVLVEEYRGELRAAADRQAKLEGRPFELERYWFPSDAAPAARPSDDLERRALDVILAALVPDDSAAALDAPLAELGVDSLSIGALVSRLESALDVSIRKSDLFSHSTPRRLAKHVASSPRRPIVAGSSEGDASAARPFEDGDDDIAIIGMSLRVAGADDHEAFWRLLRDGRCAISELPAARAGDADEPVAGIRGGFLSSIDTFDPMFFNIAPRDCHTMDPRHRLLLEGAWAAIEDSGHDAEEWSGATNGIFLGIEESDYPVSRQSPITSVHGGTAPARIGYFLDTKGPLLAISTACSSSLVAVHYACKSILNGESDSALAGGCNIICQPERTWAALSGTGSMLSRDGTCYAFDGRANGMVMGEGVGLVVLKRLSQAIRDGDDVYAVIKGSGVNYDGRTNGLMAPSGERQRELYERVQRAAGVRPEQISYVVAHGTGTALGDPVECHALTDAFGADSAREPYCALTSPKTNVGHTQAASGIVNLITGALALHHGAIPASLNYEAANPDIDFEGGPFYVNSALRAWQDPGRVAAVSSFGHSGTNAHVVLAEGGHDEAAAQPSAGAGEPVMIVLSARTHERLRESAGRLARHPVDRLREVAYTLQVGRAAMDVRLGLVAHSVDEMRVKLEAFANGESGDERFFCGEVSGANDASATPAADEEFARVVDGWIAAGRHAEVTRAWVAGAVIDWDRLYEGQEPRRAHLPTYSFEKERYWVRGAGDEPQAGGPPAPANVEPDAPADVAPAAPESPATSLHEVLTFAEAWQPAPLTRESAPAGGVAACVLGDVAEQRAVAEALASLEPQTRWESVLADGADDMEEAFRAIRDEVGEPEVVFDLRAVGRAARLADPATIVPLIQGLAAAEIKPARALIACPFGDGLERCHADGWVGCEKSLRGILPTTRFAVVAMQVPSADSAAATHVAEWLHDEWRSSEPESVMYQEGERLVARALPTDLQPGACPLKQGGTYMITGGCGELGLLLAEHLAAEYRANFVLIGRSDLTPQKRSRLHGLISQGCGVRYLQADVGDADAMQTALAAAKERFGVIDGLIHAAGIESTQTILEKSAADFRRVADPKIEGTLVLDRVLQEEPLDFVLYFGSSAASLGDFGTCDYAIGNRFQAAFAAYRNELVAAGRRHGKTVAVGWPVWQEGGIAADKAEQTELYLKTSGQRALETQEGLDLVGRLLSDRGTRHLVLVGKRERIAQLVNPRPAGSPVAPPARTDEVRADGPATGRGRTPEMKGFSVEECLLWDLRGLVGSLLEIKRARLKADANLGDLGFDSMSLAELAEALTRHFAIDIKPSVFFGYSTLDKLGRFFMSEHHAEMRAFYGRAPGAEAEPVAQPAPLAVAADPAPAVRPEKKPARSPVGHEPIAIIGMSGRFPRARSVDAMWEMLAGGRDAIEEVPADRFDWREHYGDPAADPSKTNGRWGGFVPGVAEFDPLFFEIAPRDAEVMDPRQRLLLQESWNALEDAGYGPLQLQNQKVGVFVGAEEGDYALLAGEGAITSNHNGILASRLSYFLDLRGPVIAINTACSSGLVAAHLACESLRAGECDAAVVAGVNLILTPAGLVAMGQSDMLSDDGRCFVFDQRANGMTPGEAAVAMLLKPLSRAEADGDPIYATIRASGVNYDGKTNGITAPSGVAQTELLQEVYAKADLSHGDVEYIVTHGTGTKLGDPVEINALYDAFKGAGEQRAYCALTSTKSNFGHTFAASGLLSAVSLVQAFQHELIPASLHCENENDYIKWEESPFFVNKTPRPWPRDGQRKRVGGVSAFGMSGTNAHMVFEDYAPVRQPERDAPPFSLLVVSAKTAEALSERLGTMIEALGTESAAGEESLERISHTLLNGRHHFRCRAAVVVQDRDDAVIALQACAARERRPNLFMGSRPLEFKGQRAIRKHAEDLLRQCRDRAVSAEDYQEALLALADYYCQGYDFDWSLLFGERPPGRVHLPTYPFERGHYWVSGKGTAPGSGAHLGGRGTGRSVDRLHPLLHRNTSDFSVQQFSSVFTGREAFLADHAINGQEVLPAVGILEMVRAAMEQSVAAQERLAGFRLRNVVWMRPLAVSGDGVEVVLALEEADGDVEFECRSRPCQHDGAWTTHARGMVSLLETAPETLDVQALSDRHNERLAAGECYAGFEAGGMQYGPFYKALRELWIGVDEALAQIALPEAARQGADAFVLHPGLMDAAFQSTLGLAARSEGPSVARVPFALDSLIVYGVCPRRAWAWTRRSPGSAAGDEIEKFDIDLCDESGNLAVRLQGLSTRPWQGGSGDESTRVHKLTGEEFFLADHGGLLPGVVSLEWARAAAAAAQPKPVIGLKQVVWSHPVRVDGAGCEVRTTVQSHGDALAYQVSAGELVHAQGAVVVGESTSTRSTRPAVPVPASVDIDEIRERCGVTMDQEACERALRAGLGPALRSLVRFQHNGAEGLASLELPECVRSTFDSYRLHPSLMNGALQVANLLWMARNPGGRPPVPFSIEALWIHGGLPAEAFVHVAPSDRGGQVGSGSGSELFDILIADQNGRAAVSISGYCAVTADKAGTDGIIYAVPGWKQEPTGDVAAGSDRAGIASPVLVLDGDNAAWNSVLQQRWPDARFVVLRADRDGEVATPQSSFLEVFELVQELAAGSAESIQPLVLVVPDDSFSPTHAAIAGLFRTVRLEHAGVEARILRLPGSAGSEWDESWSDMLACEIGHPLTGVESRYDADGNRLVAALEEIVSAGAEPAHAISPGDVIWITGGLGGVGLRLARHLAEDRSAHIVLSGRSPLTEDARRALESLATDGAQVRYARCDVADPSEVAETLQSILQIEGRLHGVVHCAGVIEDARLADKTTGEVVRVLQPKIAGASALDEATRDVPLDFMVFFSSLSGVFGNPGQADYAGANAFLDELARQRNLRVRGGERSGMTVSIAWPHWRDGGMPLDDAHAELIRQSSGMTPMSADRGIAAFEQCLRTGLDHVLILHGDVATMRAKLIPAATSSTVSEAAPSADARQDASHGEVLRILVDVVAEQQKVPLDRIEPDAELSQYGYDSLAFTELANRLNRSFDLELMPTLFFQRSSLSSLAAYLLENHPDKLSARPVPPATSEPASAAPASSGQTSRVDPPRSRRQRRAAPRRDAVEQPTPIAVVGMSGRFPGAGDVDAFWRLVEANRDMVSEVPADRWDWRELYGDPLAQPGKTRVKSAAFMEGVDRFDPAFFGISPREAIGMDPQLRLLMETAWAAIEDAGYRAGELSGRRVGVFMGVSTSDYKDAWLQHVAGDRGADGPALVSHFVVANRISYSLDLRGPSEPIDTACSSSLIAIHRACEAMKLGHCESALVGGVNLILTPGIMVGASRAGMLSEDGRCKTFDKRADGYGRGEGVAVLLLKPIDKALRDGDHIHGLVRGSAENHGGRAASPTAPNPDAQQELLVEAYTRSGVDPRSVGYIEAHGTGTSMGDAVEIDGLKAAFEELYRAQGAEIRDRHCGLGSVKTNVGHLEAAAGMAGVIKVIQMLRHHKIPGNPHLQEPNPYLRLDETPFYLADETRDWQSPLDESGRPLPRRAGVSSFGVGGSNAHVILEAFHDDARVTPVSRPEAARPEVLVLSAKNVDRLEASAGRLLAFLQDPLGGAHLPLRDIAWTLQIGREPMEERLGLVAADRGDAIEKLASFLARDEGGAYRRNRVARSDTRRPDAPPEGAADPESMLEAWMEGAEVDWSRLHRESAARRVGLPTYPFERKRFWFGERPEDKRGAESAPEAAGPSAPAAPARAVPPSSSSATTERIAETLAEMLAEILYMDVSDIGFAEPFIDMGLDSVLAVEWIQAVNQRFGVKIPATRTYDHPDVTAFAAFLAGIVDEQAAVAEEPGGADAPSLDEVLERVRSGEMDIEEAEHFLEKRLPRKAPKQAS